MTLIHKTFLGRIPAHIDIDGYERTDVLVHAATKYTRIEFKLPSPLSYVKWVLNDRLLLAWQDRYDVLDKRRHIYNLIIKISWKLYIIFLTHNSIPHWYGRFK